MKERSERLPRLPEKLGPAASLAGIILMVAAACTGAKDENPQGYSPDTTSTPAPTETLKPIATPETRLIIPTVTPESQIVLTHEQVEQAVQQMADVRKAAETWLHPNLLGTRRPIVVMSNSSLIDAEDAPAWVRYNQEDGGRRVLTGLRTGPDGIVLAVVENIYGETGQLSQSEIYTDIIGLVELDEELKAWGANLPPIAPFTPDLISIPNQNPKVPENQLVTAAEALFKLPRGLNWQTTSVRYEGGPVPAKTATVDLPDGRKLKVLIDIYGMATLTINY